MGGNDPIVSITVSSAMGIIIVGMAIAYYINKWKKKRERRAQNGQYQGGPVYLPIRVLEFVNKILYRSD